MTTGSVQRRSGGVARSARRAPRALAVVLAGAFAVGSAACGDDGGDATTPLPPVGDGPALSYRIEYSVITPDASTTEVREVRRPFDAHVVALDATGEVTTERWSTLGAVVTRSAGAPAAALAVAVAPALGDSRYDRFADELVRVGRATSGGVGSVGGRPCTTTTVESVAGLLGDAPGAGAEDVTPTRVVVDRCVDAQGIVLEERWASPDGERLLTKRAVDLEVDGDLDPAGAIPDAESTEGGGSFRAVAADAVLPFPEWFSVEVPDDYEAVGRFAVVPPRLRTQETTAADAQLSISTDVWVRGADVVQLDQGVGTGGATPFDRALTWREITLPDLGTAELGGDERGAEVRLRRPGGGFVRLAGTIPVDELVVLAARIRLEP